MQANKTLLESLVNNLITNAIRHNIPGGTISVSTGTNLLVITNTGVGKELNKDILFRRFGRMNENAKGSGLGLAIVRQICLLYGWEISYSFQNGLHRFTILF